VALFQELQNSGHQHGCARAQQTTSSKREREEHNQKNEVPGQAARGAVDSLARVAVDELTVVACVCGLGKVGAAFFNEIKIIVKLNYRKPSDIVPNQKKKIFRLRPGLNAKKKSAFFRITFMPWHQYCVVYQFFCDCV
jgi:hypothetical protein